MKLKYPISLLTIFISVGIYAQDITNKKHLEEISVNESARYEKLIQNRNKAVNLKSRSLNKIDGVYLGIENGLPLHIMTNDLGQAISTNARLLHHKSNPLNIKATGLNVPIFMWDEGSVMTTHQEFPNRVTNRENVPLSYHSTAVAGVMIGNGTYPDAIGMAWESTVRAYDFENNTSEIAKEAGKNPNLLLSNHSYGYIAGWNHINGNEGYGWYWYGYPSVNEEESNLYGYYSTEDKIMDNITYNSPNNIIVKSAGNDRGNGPTAQVPHWFLNEKGKWFKGNAKRPANCGKTGYDCIPFESVAKNILLVGSTLKLTNAYRSPKDVVASGFSSFGPTDDGRIKPDIVAPGSDIITPNNLYSNSYSTISGTSFSAPAVTGIIALLQEINYKKTKRYLRSDEVKALITSTANEAGLHKGPDYSFGWGIIDAVKAAEAIVTSSVSKRALSNDMADELEVIAKGNTALKVSIAWLDPSAKVIAQPNNPLSFNNRTPTLVNDLDLRIFDSSGKEHFPWALNVEDPSAAAVQKDNIVDNIEQVLIETPIAGETYTIRVSHKGILRDNLDNNSPSQVYALVVLGSEQTYIPENNEGELLLYPIPSSDYINFRMASSLTNVHLKIFDVNGSLLFQKRYDELISGEKLNISYLSLGHYLLILESNEKNYVKKIIKK